jgi:CBS domain-containing protein
MPYTTADDFLNAYNEIESKLERLLQKDKSAGFKQLVREQADRTFGPVRTHKDDLLEFADLRNAIVHSERSGGEVIADPRSGVVEKIIHIRDAIIDPPSVIPRFGGDVTTVREDAPLSRVVRKMQERNYSQVPIKENGQIKGLLTANTIARWAGANVEQDASGEILLTDETTVSAVQSHAEREENYEFLDRDATLFDAAEAFQVKPDDYGPIDAALITENGRPMESLLSIITMADLPEIHEEL